MPELLFNDFLALAHALGEHPARLAIWEEGALAMKFSGGARCAVTRRNASLLTLAADDIVQLDLAKMNELLALDFIPPEELAAAQIDPHAKTAPCRDAMLLAYLLSLDGVRVVAHLHPPVVDQITASPRARQFADRRTLFNESLTLGAAWMMVPYCEPGVPSAREMQRKMALWRERYRSVPRVILVQNNGVLVLGKNGRDILRHAELLIKYAEVFLGAAVLGGPVFLTPQNIFGIEAIRETESEK